MMHHTSIWTEARWMWTPWWQSMGTHSLQAIHTHRWHDSPPHLHGYSHSVACTISEENDKLLAIFSSVQSADTKEDSGNVFHVAYVVLRPGGLMTIPRIQTRRLNPILTRTTNILLVLCYHNNWPRLYLILTEGCNMLIINHHILYCGFEAPITNQTRRKTVAWLNASLHLSETAVQSKQITSKETSAAISPLITSLLRQWGKKKKSDPLTGMMITIYEVV